MRILVAGASGYVGSRLVPALLRAGHDVRASARDRESLRPFDWAAEAELISLDAASPGQCASAVEGVDAVFYLVHGLGEGDFAATDREAAKAFGAAARDADVDRVIYLGGLVPDGERLSEHLESRAEVGEILAGHVPTVWLRAAVIIGAGSTSFEIIRYVAERLPVILAPSWMATRVQPIAIDDVLYYCIAGLDLPPGSYDIGAEESMPYLSLITRYIRIARLGRPVVKVPGPVTPWLASLVLGRLTPVPAALTSDLIESLANTMVVGDDRIRSLVPDPPGGLTTVDEAILRALAVTSQDEVDGVSATADTLQLTATDPEWAGGDVYRCARSRDSDASVARLWAAVARLPTTLPPSWRLGGFLTRLAPVPKLQLTVESVDPGRLMRLAMTDEGTGRGVLRVGVEKRGAGSRLTVEATWKPNGLRGHGFWLAWLPWQQVLLPDLLRSVTASAIRVPS